MKKPIYLDYNATTPIDPQVAEAMLPFIHQHFGNPSSSHSYGVTAKRAVEKARKQTAELLRCGTDEIIFTSGGSESNNYAIKGAAFANQKKGNHIITSSIEHPAVMEVCRYLESNGFTVTYLPVDEYGLVNIKEVEKAIRPETILISIMHANNEVGTIEPLSDISNLAHERGILVHTDAAQTAGKIPVHVDELGVDLLSIAGHKFYALKGIGALYIRSGIKLEKLIHGADHEMNFRAGTENVIGIVGLGEACSIGVKELEIKRKEMNAMRERLVRGLVEHFPDIKINGHPELRLPNTLSISFKNLDASTIVSEFDRVAASAGAACHSNKIDASTVLKAMKVPVEFAMGTVRFSVGRFTTPEEIDEALEEIISVVEKLQPEGISELGNSDSGKIYLTQYTHGLGCACKLRPQLLEEVLKNMSVHPDNKILVGTETSDDAAVYQIDEQTAIVQTVDFFTPIVDDPFQFGAIAASNSLSDIYAMGGKPLFGLNIVGFPSRRLPINVLKQILEGARYTGNKAGISIIGGHTVEDTEPKFGLAVTGVINPKMIIKNNNAQPGDSLILTKPLGTGILSTALKRKLIDDEQMELLVETMKALNKDASEAMLQFKANSCTDITGFGLLGHLLEMMKASGTSAEIYFNKIPFLSGAIELASSGYIPGGTVNNKDFVSPYVDYHPQLSETKILMVNDAQTSGGLLISIPAQNGELLAAHLKRMGIERAAIIGRIIKGEGKKIFILE